MNSTKWVEHSNARRVRLMLLKHLLIVSLPIESLFWRLQAFLAKISQFGDAIELKNRHKLNDNDYRKSGERWSLAMRLSPANGSAISFSLDRKLKSRLSSVRALIPENPRLELIFRSRNETFEWLIIKRVNRGENSWTWSCRRRFIVMLFGRCDEEDCLHAFITSPQPSWYSTCRGLTSDDCAIKMSLGNGSVVTH